MAWWEDYFTEDWMRFRDEKALLRKAPSEVDFLEKALKISPPAEILDVGCGFGRHSVELSLRGYKVTGVDTSSGLLARAREMARQKGISVSWTQQDMRNIDFHAQFDAAICLFTTFGYFESEEENYDVLCRISKALRPGARFVLDVENRDGILMRYMARDWQQTESGDLVMEERWFDPIRGRGHTKMVLVSGGRTSTHNLSIRWYSVPELKRMIEDAGMQIDELYGDLDGSEFRLNAWRLIIVAEKR